MTKHDDFIHEQVKDMLDEGEAVEYTAFVLKQPGGVFFLLLGPLVTLFFTTPYLLAVTDRRIILIKAKIGAFYPKMVNLGTETILIDQIEKITRGGIGKNRCLTFDFANDSESRRFRLSPSNKCCSGQREFYDGWVDSINGRQLSG